ncbi:glycosyltransferase family 2 protein [Chryseobacterium sp. 3008163]|uniref:glycosyltransferase family 2 protein n=1 Tax=Chryseobacterium sp. 3008163 TaxID=2478663 RepID=UPI000F0CD462|nr:glycosyltransferase [Chryseobacterium sp. 3008163]AYN00759.1 glycosyltransferase family 2 protein [Chryseobacterium sp. 3008163]
MKLSVCIPVYNFDVRELVFDLKKEIKENLIDAEIILIDDASDEKFKTINKELQNEVKSFVLLEKNIGRSKIRNLFLQYAEGDYLLFLDCDAKIERSDFISNYLSEINQDNRVEVIYGNFKISPLYSQSLRNKYSAEREIFPENKSTDFSVFKTVNFVIKKEVFRKFPFHEELIHYGYEDYVFAKKMELAKVRFSAINNPVIHIDETANDVFLDKTKTAIDSLYQLSQNSENLIYIKDIKVFFIAQKLKKNNLSTLFLFFYSILEKKMIKNLLSNKPNLRSLDFFKLGLLLRKMR